MLRFIRDNTFLDIDDKPDFALYLIILNRPLNKEIFCDLYKKASIVICADGGANRLFNLFKEDIERYNFISTKFSYFLGSSTCLTKSLVILTA